MEKQMANPQDNKPSEQETAVAAPKSGSGAATAFIFLAIVFSLAAAGMTFLLTQKLQQTKAELAQQVENIRNNLSQITVKVNGDMNARVMNLSDKMASIGAEQEQFQAQVSEQQKATQKLAKELRLSNQQMRQSIDVLFKQKGRERIGWVLEEVEYLLLVANHSLKLQHNVATAIAALEAADARLLDTGDPGTIEIRNRIREEIQTLRALKQPDIVGMAARLSSLIQASADLPIKYTQINTRQKVASMVDKEASHEAGSLEQASKEFLHELRGLVVFRKLDEKPKPLMTPKEQFFLQQNLQLKLETARRAVLMAQQDLFRTSIQEAISWLQGYFDMEVPKVQQAKDELTRLQAMTITSTMPDISASIKVLRNYQNTLEQNSLERTNTSSLEPGQQHEAQL